MAVKNTPLALIKKYFFTNGETSQQIMSEIKLLSKDERIELARLIAVELGVEVDE